MAFSPTGIAYSLQSVHDFFTGIFTPASISRSGNESGLHIYYNYNEERAR
jgi:hypothetical protein